MTQTSPETRRLIGPLVKRMVEITAALRPNSWISTPETAAYHDAVTPQVVQQLLSDADALAALREQVKKLPDYHIWRTTGDTTCAWCAATWPTYTGAHPANGCLEVERRSWEAR